MEREIKDKIGRVTCGNCMYFNVKADLPEEESRCRRLDHKTYRFAMPYFRCYDCGQYNSNICREFRPNTVYKYLEDQWTDFDDWTNGKIHEGYVGITVGGDKTVRYYVRYRDFVYGTHVNPDGSLNWVKKCYYKQTRENEIGYKLVCVCNQEGVKSMEVSKLLELDFRDEENRKEIQKELRSIKPLSKCPDGKDVPMELIEKLVYVLYRKYHLFVRELTPDMDSNSDAVVWRAVVGNGDTLKIVRRIWGLSLYEVMAKIAICMMAEKETAGRRDSV